MHGLRVTFFHPQVMTYVQLLWEQVVKDNPESSSTRYNGSVEAIYTLLSKRRYMLGV